MKKHFLFLAMCIATILSANGQTSVWDGSHTAWTKGDGTQANPYQIETAAQLAHLAYVVNNGIGADGGRIVGANTYWKLMTNIDLNGSQTFQWTPIGIYNIDANYSYAFGGNFDGNGKTITNLFINASTQQGIGLFAYTNGATIKNTGITGSGSVTRASSTVSAYAGAITGYANNTVFDNCYNMGKVSASSSYRDYCSGGIVGYIVGGSIINCYNTGSIAATSSATTNSAYDSNYSAGGIAGYISSGTTVSNCYNTGVVSSSSFFYSHSGGIAGYINGGTINNCHNTGSVSASATSSTGYSYYYSGGIAGYANSTDFNNCYNTGNVSASANAYFSYSGGITGNTSGGTITNCYNEGTVSASSTSYSGGIAGYTSSTITNCNNTGSVTGYESGGITAFSYGTINNSYNTGQISSSNCSGGIVGAGDLKINNCYNVGTIVGIYKGGIIGYVNAVNTTVINNSYYLDTCGGGNIYGNARTEAQMKEAAFVSLLNVQGFNYKRDITPFVNNGYPVLALTQGFEMQLRPAANITQTKAALECLLIVGDVNVAAKQLVCNNQTYNITSTNTLLTQTVSGLTPNTEYSYIFRVINSDNDTCRVTGTFTTLSVTATTQVATNVTQTKATLNGEVVFGDATVTKGFEYKLSTDANYTSVNASGSNTGITSNLTGLLPSKTYQYRTFCTYNGNTIYGAVNSFTTLAITTATNPATNITQTKATLNGEIVCDDATATKGFEYKLSTDANYTSINVSGSNTGITSNLTGLLPNNIYQFRTFCTYNGNTIYGTVNNFTTLAVTTITNPATNITRSTATLNGTSSFGDATVLEQGFILTEPTGNDTIAVSNTTTTLTYNTVDLPHGATFSYKTYCTTAGGTVYGAVQNFNTLAFNSDGDNYLIENKEDLILLANLVNGGNSFAGKTFVLANDITLPNTPNNILSIGNYQTNRPFSGAFDGNGKHIYNVYIDQPNTPYQGFFGYTQNARLSKVGLVNITASGRNFTGGMVGYAENTKIDDSYVSGGTLFALSYCGGLVGYQTQGTNSIITGCYNTCTVTGNNYVGGLLGFSDQGTVRNSYVAALVTGNGTGVGAIIGGAQDVLSYNCYFNEDITGQSFAIGENNISLRSTTSEGNMSSGDMRMQSFVTTLNQGLITPMWKMDYATPINNGFPILIWQSNSPTGIEEPLQTISMQIYPNPVKNELFIKSDSQIKKVEIYSLTGALLLSENNFTGKIFISSLPKGIYLVKVYAVNGLSISKIVKE